MTPELSLKKIPISMNTENHEASPTGNLNDSIDVSNEKLLAKNEPKERNGEKNTSKLTGDQVLSFDKEFVSIQETKEDLEKELVQVDGEIRVVKEKEKQSQLTKKLKSGEISKSVYDSRMYMLKFQMDELYWQKSHTLIKLNRINEAIVLLNEIRNENGVFQSKADSLYKELKE